MHKIIRISLYLIILLIYNITTLYTSSVHNHQFSWTDEENCPAYIISTTQISDTFSFSINQTLKTPKVDLLEYQIYDIDFNFNLISIFSKRAPPIFI